ncbi:MAG: sulfatase-like hydrolase/transferase [Opitutales bacterium]|nr:sulfatase-like hydrolase/transferase [Opitutales bacterium]
MKNPPNILFILADQLNAKCLGHAGHAHVRTPNLDRLAAEGTAFHHSVCNNPICTPSRMCFLSGMYAHNHGYYGLGGPRPNMPTVFGHFRARGYTSAVIGKSHCPLGWIENDCDVFEETCVVKERTTGYRRHLHRRGMDDDDHDAVVVDGRRHRQTLDAAPSALEFADSQEGWIAEECIRFMQQAQADGKPFICQAGLPRPHQVTAPCQRFWDLYADLDLELPPTADLDLEAAGKPPHLIARAALWRRGDWAIYEPKDFAAARLRKLHGYFAAISQVDASVGLLFDHLDATGLRENTIVVFSSDHGEFACEQGIMEKAPGIGADAVTRIPFIWRGPGIAAGRRLRGGAVESVDLAPTLCALAGLPPMRTVDGEDLSTVLGGGAEKPDRIVVTENVWAKSLRRGGLRYVHYPRTMWPEQYPQGFCELYDTDADPWEARNLALDPEYTALREELTNELLEWLLTRQRIVNVVGHNQMGDLRIPGGVQCHGSSLALDGRIDPRLLRDRPQRDYC